MLICYLCAWFIIMAAAIGNGFAREALFKAALGDLRAHQLSTLTLILLIGGIVWAIQRVWPLASAKEARRVGILWLAMTIAFEFLFGHYVAGHAWTKLLADYNIFAGRIWLLVLAWVAIAPYAVFRSARLAS